MTDYLANDKGWFIVLKRLKDLFKEIQSDYFETYIEGEGAIYTVNKYRIYEDKTDGVDIGPAYCSPLDILEESIRSIKGVK